MTEEILKFEATSTNEYCEKIVISYGEHKTEIRLNPTLSDLIDCNGLCATDEVAVQLIEDLEFGHNRKLFRLFENMTTDLLEKFRIYKLKPEDKSNIWLLCNAIRGKHKCVRKS